MSSALLYPVVLQLQTLPDSQSLNIWTTNDNALYTAGLGLANIFHQKKKPMVLISGIIGTILSVWLYYNFCNWLNVLNWGISSINGMMVAVVCYLIGYFVKKNQRSIIRPNSAEVLCEMEMTVRSFATCFNASNTAFSVSASRFAVISSNSSICGSATAALAMDKSNSKLYPIRKV